MARIVIEVRTHSAVGAGRDHRVGHEVLVAKPPLLEGSKRRKRKSDRIDANKLARLGRVDPQSLFPIRHRSREVRQDLVVLRARDALVSVRTELINAMRGLVKSNGHTTAAVFAELRRNPSRYAFLWLGVVSHSRAGDQSGLVYFDLNIVIFVWMARRT